MSNLIISRPLPHFISKLIIKRSLSILLPLIMSRPRIPIIHLLLIPPIHRISLNRPMRMFSIIISRSWIFLNPKQIFSFIRPKNSSSCFIEMTFNFFIISRSRLVFRRRKRQKPLFFSTRKSFFIKPRSRFIRTRSWILNFLWF